MLIPICLLFLSFSPWVFHIVVGHPNGFESDSPNELWTFLNSEQIEETIRDSKLSQLLGSQFVPPTRGSAKDDNFRVVVGSGLNHSNHYAYYSSREPKIITPMIVSAYFQHTASSCELVFRHRIHGVAGSELVITTQHLEHSALLTHQDEENDEDAEDWVRPTLRAAFKPLRDELEQWTLSRVPIGQTLFPTRIRIECHSAKQQRDPSLLNVECNVDDVNLVNCDEEIWKADECSGKQTKRYLCRRKGAQKCIDYSDVCDFHSECEDAEDEDNSLHKCNLVPPGARCDFETNTETGCAHWRFFAPSNDSSQYLRRIGPKDFGGLSSKLGLPPSEYLYHGSRRVAENFLFFSTYGALESQSGGDVLYNSAVSPIFPPTSVSTSLSDSPLYKTCMVRFFYCHTGTSTFQLMLESGADFSHKEVLWTPSRTAGSEPCSWQKATALIPHQSGEYRLKLAFGKLYRQPVSVAVDDFSITPNCFIEQSSWSSRFAADRVEIGSCGSGPQPPTPKECPTPNDRKSLLIPSTGIYRFELFGASGGFLTSSQTNNRGGSLILHLKLQRNQEVSFVVGRLGSSLCNISQPKDPKLEKFWRIICRRDSASGGDLEMARRDAQNLFGSGGGGASALFVDEQLIAVAGGGGGVVPEFIRLLDDSAVESAGGHLDENPTVEKISSSNWSSGFGVSFDRSARFLPNSSGCADCGQMWGQWRSLNGRTEYIGGECPKGRLWNISGGYGGGGASCGPGAGGGGGFKGGASGHKTNAEGGSSAVLSKSAAFVWSKGSNEGNGRILMIRCSLKCPQNSSCLFEKPTIGHSAVPFCLCSNGKRTDPTGSCIPSDLKSAIIRLGNALAKSMDMEANTLFYLLVGIIAFVALICWFFVFFSLILGFCVCYACLRLRYVCCLPSLIDRAKCCLLPRKGNDFPDIMELSSTMDSRIRSNGNRITSNPIYERLTMVELPHISRHFLQLKQSVGHGAFGEVYEGFFNLDGAITRVAVKTLPIDSNPDTECDFETEARLLNQFDHPNIVKFYGVSFEQLPKYIILEYLEGGDLRNFLRECRPKPQTQMEDIPVRMLDLIHMALDVAHGCAYLEHSRFIHRDIAARNCLLTTKGAGRVVKIADFGMARDIFSSEYYRKGGRAFLAVKWMPPEGFLDGIFNSKTDVWSFGVLLWEIFSMGYMPYTMKQNQEVMQLVVAGGRLEPPIGAPEKIYEQMLRCWNTEAEARPAFDQIVDFLSELATDPQMATLPVPPLIPRAPSGTPSTSRSSIPPTPDDVATSQATISTNTGTSESTTNSTVSMPTNGEGISMNVFPPYEPRFSKPLMEIRSNFRTPLRESSLSSHDDSTLHDSCSVKQSPYRIEKDLKALQTAGSRKPFVFDESMPLIGTPTTVAPPPPPRVAERSSDPPTPSSAESAPAAVIESDSGYANDPSSPDI